jgi:tetratricopeptide (TPR) repeat protein
MNPIACWSAAFVLTSITAATLLVANRAPVAEAVAPRDPAKLTEIESELILTHIREGDLTAIQGNLAGARALWDAARERGGGLWPVHEALGDSLARHGLEKEAAAEFETAARLAERQLGKEPVALRVKRAGLLIRQDRQEAALNLLIEAGQPDRLAVAMAEMVKRSPPLLEVVKRGAHTRDPRLWALVAGIAPDAGDRVTARARYWKFVAPSDAALARRVIGELHDLRRPDEALELCEAWSKGSPSNPDVYETWGRLLAATGRRDRALLVLSTIVDIKAGDAAAHARLGAALRELGEFDLAVRQFEEVARLRPEEPAGLQEVVVTRLAQGDLQAAMMEHERLTSRPWESRFGDVRVGVRNEAAEAARRAIDAAKKAGDSATVARIRRWCSDLGVAEAGLFDVKVILTWDAMSDVDLDVAEPGGEILNHGHATSKSGGRYHVDNTRGRGPEYYTLPKAPAGKYRVGVHLHGSTRSVADIEVILFEDTPRERRLTARVTLAGAESTVWPVEFDVP